MRVVQNYWATFYFPVFNVKSLVIILSKTSVSPEFVNNIIGNLQGFFYYALYTRYCGFTIVAET